MQQLSSGNVDKEIRISLILWAEHFFLGLSCKYFPGQLFLTKNPEVESSAGTSIQL